MPGHPTEPPAGEYAMVAVADTGSGIDPAIIDHVFDPFFTTKEVGRGSGLGLSQVLGVAQQLGGGVGIASSPGGGTTVNVYIPRLRAAAAAGGGPSPRRQPEIAVSGRSGTILLVDDDADVRSVAAAMLQQAGHTVIEAGSGPAALKRLDGDTGCVDLLIADLAMPGMSGFELARVVRDSRPRLPILFVTGYADNAARLDSIDAHRLLLKPFHAAELNAKVAEALGRAAAAG
jgi:CheY-like chemotaxis protein